MKQKSASSVRLSFLLLSESLLCAIIISLMVFFGVLSVPTAIADTAEQIQQKIADQTAKIAELEKEIALYEKELTTIGGQKLTLEGEIKRLDISRKKIGADISVTENKITEATLQLEELGGEIEDKEVRVDKSTETIRESFRSVYQAEATTLVEHMFTARGLADAWEEVDKQRALRNALQEEILELLETKEALTVDLNATQKKQNELKSLKRELASQKLVLDQNRQEQSTLLADTKNRESAYQKLLTEKQQAKLDFERQIADFEAQLKFTLDPNQIPKAGSGVLRWPIDPSVMVRCKDRFSTFKNSYCITQYFGDTEFARSGAYDGKGHNGIDFGISSGTKIVSALSGTVIATGNTDAYKGCYSYGKWVLVRHVNGLSTLYAHLSIISVSAGDPVATGSLIGYSGKTGYATGPHLHFTLYVSDAVQLVRLGDIKAKTNCAGATVPVAPTEAYLNPMSYL